MAAVADYTFWWIRILNAHFAITDWCGHYPYWIRWLGFDWTEEDKEFMRQTNSYSYDPKDESIYEQVKKDSKEGVWPPMQPNPKYENKESAINGTNPKD